MRLLLGSEEHTSELQSPCNLVCGFCLDRKSTRLNSSHLVISYAVFCLKKKKNNHRSFARARPEIPGSTPARKIPKQTSAPTSARAKYATKPKPTSVLFFFNDTATTEIYTLSLHDALPI